MPLSEHEQKLLEQMERAIAAEDPSFASTMRGASSGTKRRWAFGALGVIAGLGVVVLGVARAQLWLSGIGFIVMVLALVYAMTPARRPTLGSVQADGSVRPAGPRKPAGPTFMQRMEQRWDKRENGPWS